MKRSRNQKPIHFADPSTFLAPPASKRAKKTRKKTHKPWESDAAPPAQLTFRDVSREDTEDWSL